MQPLSPRECFLLLFFGVSRGFELTLFDPNSLPGQCGHLFFAWLFKDIFARGEKKHPPEPFSVKQMKIFFFNLTIRNIMRRLQTLELKHSYYERVTSCITTPCSRHVYVCVYVCICVCVCISLSVLSNSLRHHGL